MVSFELDGKVAVVTGALGLLGREHCAALAGAGARVVLADLNGAACGDLAAALAAAHRVPALGVGCDVTSPDAVETLVERTLATFGSLDVLVNNAAIDDKFSADAADESRFEQYSVERFRRMLDVNVVGTFLCAQRIGRRMAARGSGSIINIASTYGVVAPQQALYQRADRLAVVLQVARVPDEQGRSPSIYSVSGGLLGLRRGTRERSVSRRRGARSRSALSRRVRAAHPARSYGGALGLSRCALVLGQQCVGIHDRCKSDCRRRLDDVVKLSSSELALRASRIKLVVSDVDGVLTDAGVYYSARGEEMKRFSMRDGMGVERLRHVGIETAFLTREDSPIVVQRAHKLRIPHVHLAVLDKREFMARWVLKLGISLGRVAYIGDDINDLEAMRFVGEHGLTAAPSDAAPEILRETHFCATLAGGQGAFRQLADWIVNSHTQEHDG